MTLRELGRRAYSAALLWPWLGLVALTLGTGPYGLTEPGAKALLVAWSVGDAVASAAFTLGAPDVRALLLLPAGFILPGEVIVARVLTLLAMALAGYGLYRWRSREGQGEAALLATGLLLLAPGCIAGVGAVSAAPYLLLCFVIVELLDRYVEREQSSLGASFFLQLAACAAAISLHPAGLACPALLLRRWLAMPADNRHRMHFLAGLPVITALVLTMRLGWPGSPWLHSPLPAAAALFTGSLGVSSMAAPLAGIGLIVLALVTAAHEARRLLADVLGGLLLLAVLIGAVAADETWALLLLAFVLYAGLPWLLRGLEGLSGRGFMLQRGWLWLLLMVVCTVFMWVNRGQYEAVRHHRLSAEDQLLADFADGLNSVRAESPPAAPAGAAPGAAAPAAMPPPLLVASSWPARTALACRCDGLPLPPVAKDPAAQFAMMKGISYVILGADGENAVLSSNLAQLNRQVEVVAREPGGVILHFR